MREKILSVTLKDCRVDTFRAGGPGGQKQNKTNSACAQCGQNPCPVIQPDMT